MNESSDINIPPELRKRLHRPSDFRGALQMASHLALLAAIGLALNLSWSSAWIWLTMPAYAILLIFLFAPLHETIHRTAFERRWLNDGVAALLGFLLFVPARRFRYFHLAHHRHTQDIERDPELLQPRPSTRWQWLWHVSGLPLWRGQLTGIWRHALGRFDAEEVDGPRAYIDAGKRVAVQREARIHLAGYALLAIVALLSSSAAIWWYWLLPLLIGQPFLRLFLLAEHAGCEFSDDMLKNSRTTYATPVLTFLCWNMCYHAEHHYLAAVPFFSLPALHAYTGARVDHRGDGYLRVNREIFDGLK